MSDPIIKIENISKQYRLGTIGTSTLRGDIQRWWYKIRGKEDPALKIGTSNRLDTIDDEYVWALRDINLEVKEGEVVGIIGKNGAGKSTLLKILSRVTGPTTGSIKVKGRIASLLEVGTGFHPELTGKENIFLNGAILGMTKAEIKSKLDEIIEFAGVAKYINTPVKRYSSGMYVRLAFAVAAHLEPEILVVDEVLAVGDAEFQKKAIGKMQDVSQNGRTVLFVSHNMAAVKNLCNRGILLKNGGINCDDIVETVIQDYVSGFSEKTDLQSGNITRTGAGNLQFTKWTVTDPVLGEGNQIKPNSPATLNFYLKVNSQSEYKNIILAFVIKDNFDQPIFGGDSRLVNKVFSSKKGDNEIIVRCNLEKVPLMPGNYILHLYCSANELVMDRITNAGVLEVIDDDFSGTGRKLFTNKHGSIYIHQNWQN